MCLQPPPKASAALSALTMVPRPPNPFPEVQEPHVAPFVLFIQCLWATDVLKRATTSRSFPFHIPTIFQLPNLVLIHNFMSQEF